MMINSLSKQKWMLSFHTIQIYTYVPQYPLILLKEKATNSCIDNFFIGQDIFTKIGTDYCQFYNLRT